MGSVYSCFHLLDQCLLAYMFSSFFCKVFLTKFNFLSLIHHSIGNIPTSQSRIACVTECGRCKTLLMNLFWNFCNSFICFSVIPINDVQQCNRGCITNDSKRLNAILLFLKPPIKGVFAI